MKNKKDIYRGGVIPFYYKGDQLLMMFMKPSDAKYGGKRYQIAKGKQEPGEDLFDTAMREANEELGLFKGNVDLTKHLGRFLGRTDIYIARIKNPDMFGDYTDETESVTWMTPEEFQAEGRDLHKPVVAAAVRLIEKLHKEQ